MPNATISRIAFHLPDKVLDNDYFAELFPEWNSKQILDHIGIRERRVAAEGETAFDLGLAAAEKVLQDYPRETIDFVMLCTQHPDYILPTSACVMQDRLGLSTSCGALDYNLGCSGFVYGLAMAKGLIAAGVASRVLLITAETYSKSLHPSDKGNRTIFGDGAAAPIIEASELAGIGEFVIGTDGAGHEKLIIRNGAARAMCAGTGDAESGDFLFMNGPDVFNFTVATVPKLFAQTLEKNQLAMDDLHLVVFHQANKFILDFLRKKAKIPQEKFFIDLEEVGNTVSATIPIALCQAREKGLIASNKPVMLVGFGVGLSWGAVTVQFDDQFITTP